MSAGYEDVVILVSSHGLEDFPTELGEGPAAGLLNAFAVAWHPAVLASTGSMPTWERADDPPERIGKRLIFIPEPAEEWLPGGWATRAESEGATVVRGVESREDNVAAALSGLEDPPAVDDDLVADFIALGTCWLQVELLTRQMHHFSNLDDAQLQREAVAAAHSAVAGDAEAARKHLGKCFEALHEARERFYPVDCYLLDLCLLIPELADEHLRATLATSQPKNLLLSGDDLVAIAEADGSMVDAMRDACEAGTLGIVGGEFHERPTTLIPLQSLLHEFDRGRREYVERLGHAPRTWGRRRFGLTTMMPQILTRWGYQAALHLVLDDGFYPDAEGSRERWEGCDGSMIDAFSRLPLAADSAASFLRFAQRMAESMEGDQVAALAFARWPEIKSPWMEDFVRIGRYAPVLGRFVTFDEFASETDTPGRMTNHHEDEYFTPFLVQSVARREAFPASRYATHLRRRTLFDAAEWLRGTASVLLGGEPNLTEGATLEAELEAAGPDPIEPDDTETSDGEESTATEPPAETPVDDLEPRLHAWLGRSAGRMAELVVGGAESRPGRLVFNPHSFPRRIVCDLGEANAHVGGPVKTVQVDDLRRSALVDVPACGYAWFPLADAPPPQEGPATVEENVIRNEFFEVHVNRETGGIQTIKEYGRRPNRLSQQLGYRFARERAVAPPPEMPDAPTEHTFYSRMVCTGFDVTCAGPAMGEIVTKGDLIDPSNGDVLARFSQRFRLWRGRRTLDLGIALAVKRRPEGSPWNEYVASRFAWNDPTATVSRSVHGRAHVVKSERIESLHYVEVASDDERTTIVPFGMPFARKTSGRMLDAMLVTEAEDAREFRFAIAVDEPYPMHATLDALSPPIVVPTEHGPPPSGETGWFYNVSARNVIVTGVLPLIDPTSLPPTADDEGLRPTEPTGPGFALRLEETEGRARNCKLRLFRTPTSARQRDFEGRTIATLPIEGDAVQVAVNPYEIADIELRFDG